MSTKCLINSNTQDKKYLVDLFAKLIEFYIENKIEKEISDSFSQLLNLK